jgi:wyosine [tRNA(Phe)-imidazoG37] synthetase (radical SAM superfamily)
MSLTSFKYLYGPLAINRLGNTLGIDPLSQTDNVCSMSCAHCPLGRGRLWCRQRKDFVPSDLLIDEMKCLPQGVPLDSVLFAGRGEPTLARNLGYLIRHARAIIQKPVTVITNGLLIGRPDVSHDLMLADEVVLKWDAGDNGLVQLMSHPYTNVVVEDLWQQLKAFLNTFNGRFAVQMQAVQPNKNVLPLWIERLHELNAERIELMTPLLCSPVKPLDGDDIETLQSQFHHLPLVHVLAEVVMTEERDRHDVLMLRQTHHQSGQSFH